MEFCSHLYFVAPEDFSNDGGLLLSNRLPYQGIINPFPLELYFLFVSIFTLSELSLLIFRRSKKASVKIQHDRKSMISQWIIFFISLTIGNTISFLKIGKSGDPLLFKTTGIVILMIGFVIRWIGIFQLGKMFTVDVSISSSHVLKTDGLYKIVRHPTYFGLILIIFGLSLLMNNALSSIVIMIPSFCVIYYRITVEEKALIQEFDGEYLLYKKKVKMIIPFLF